MVVGIVRMVISLRLLDSPVGVLSSLNGEDCWSDVLLFVALFDVAEHLL